MTRISAEERERLLAQLATAIRRRRLTSIALLLARGLASLSIVVSHALLVAQPLLPHAAWRRGLGDYAILLEDETSWQALIDHLEASES